jgi:hypothetical protein
MADVSMPSASFEYSDRVSAGSVATLMPAFWRSRNRLQWLLGDRPGSTPVSEQYSR